MFDILGVIHAFDEFRKAIENLRYRAPKFPKRMRNSHKPALQPIALKRSCRTAGQIGRKR